MRRLSGADHTMSIPLAVALAAWSEDDPKTPVKPRRPLTDTTNKSHHVDEGENWDDDFEDNTLSPGRKLAFSPRRLDDDDAHESWDEEFAAEEAKASPLGMGPPPAASRRTPNRTRRRKSGKQPAARSPSSSADERAPAKPRYSLSEDADFYDSEEGTGEFGEDDDEEDRTVTARSKRSLNNLMQGESPPPPVPRIPFLTSPAPVSPMPSLGTSNSPRPFPRSPSSSVFSVPATVNDARSAHTYSSSAHLRPSISRSSGAATSLSHLPPTSPSKERERRRLRKKSRPHHHGAYEMTTFENRRKSDAYLYSFSDGELEDIREKEGEREVEEGWGERIVPRRVKTPEGNRNPGGSGGDRLMPPTPKGAGALLSRIGSVTSKWGGRRKRRGSVAAQEGPREGTFLYKHLSHYADAIAEVALAPIARRSMASLDVQASTSSNPAPPPSSWFFRSTSNQSHSSTASDSTANSDGDPSKSEFTPRPVGRRQTVGASSARPRTAQGLMNAGDESDDDYGVPTSFESDRDRLRVFEAHHDNDQTPVPTPAKFVKKKSMGFVALGRSIMGGEKSSSRPKQQEQDRAEESSSSLNATVVPRQRKPGLNGGSPRPMSMAVPGSLAPRAPKGRGVSDSYGRRAMEEAMRNMPIPPLPGKDDQSLHGEASPEKPVEEPKKESSGLRGIIGNVRKLSIVGRKGHKRTKLNDSTVAPPLQITTVIANSRASTGSWHRPLTPSTSVPHLRGSLDSKGRYTPSPTPSRVASNMSVSTDALSKFDSAPQPKEFDPNLFQTPPKPKRHSGRGKEQPVRDDSLPPIELQPPSPSPPNEQTPLSLDAALERKAPEPAPAEPSSSTLSPAVRAQQSSGQSATVGRASSLTATASTASTTTPVTKPAAPTTAPSSEPGTGMLRRNSLGDLKIPARISQAQVSLRRDLGMVREFANHVESEFPHVTPTLARILILHV